MTHQLTPEETETEQQTVLFFTYGTLRRGERLHDWIEDSIVTDHGIATMAGARLFYGRGHRAYPYLCRVDTPRYEAVGELYTLTLNRQVVGMFEMEQNAGYVIEEAEVMLDGEPMMAMVCAWRHEVSEPIQDNDWCSAERQREVWG